MAVTPDGPWCRTVIVAMRGLSFMAVFLSFDG
jgi:hypothetical protein